MRRGGSNQCDRTVIESVHIFPLKSCASLSRDPSGEPQYTLIKYRRTSKGVTFMQNLASRRLGRIRVGDAIEIVA